MSDSLTESDLECYVSPLEINRAVSMSYAEGRDLHKSRNTDEYDYPYVEVKNRNVPAKAVRHNKVHLTKLATCETNTSPDYSTGAKHTKEQMVRASSHVEILEPLFEADDYVKMYPGKTNSGMMKSHSYDEGRFLRSVSDQSESPPVTLSASSLIEHNNYNAIDRLTVATDGMYV